MHLIMRLACVALQNTLMSSSACSRLLRPASAMAAAGADASPGSSGAGASDADMSEGEEEEGAEEYGQAQQEQLEAGEEQEQQAGGSGIEGQGSAGAEQQQVADDDAGPSNRSAQVGRGDEPKQSCTQLIWCCAYTCRMLLVGTTALRLPLPLHHVCDACCHAVIGQHLFPPQAIQQAQQAQRVTYPRQATLAAWPGAAWYMRGLGRYAVANVSDCPVKAPYQPLGQFIEAVGRVPDNDALKVYFKRWAACAGGAGVVGAVGSPCLLLPPALSTEPHTVLALMVLCPKPPPLPPCRLKEHGWNPSVTIRKALKCGVKLDEEVAGVLRVSGLMKDSDEIGRLVWAYDKGKVGEGVMLRW
jgi:hypothetical protein